MAQYKVRTGFTVHIENAFYSEGDVIELSEEQLKLVAHQVEEVKGTKKTKVEVPDGEVQS